MFRSLLLSVLLSSVINQHGINALDLAGFQREALLQHNFRRQQHCVPPMVLNSSLNTIAQNYANLLAVNNSFHHSGTPGVGENLWAIWSSATLGYINGKNH